MIHFRLFGIPITIEPWFWITLLIIGTSGSNNMATQDALMFTGIFVLVGAISILVHELGHALTARAFGAEPSITLQAFGGFASFPSARITRSQDFLITAAGPFIQIVLGILAWIVLVNVNLPTDYSKQLFTDLRDISLFWAIINLVPVLPLDGGRLLAATLGPKRIRATMIISMVVGGLAALLFLAAGMWIFAAMLVFFAFQSYQTFKAR